MIIENDRVFDPAFLTKVKSLGDSISSVNGLQKLISPVEMVQLIEGPMGLLSIPIVHITEPEKLEFDSIRIFQHPLYSGFFGKNGKSLALQIAHDHFTTPEAGDEFIAALHNKLEQLSLNKTRIVGKLTAQSAFINLIQNDFAVFIVAALLISFLVLLLVLRSLKAALLPYLISLTSLIWLLGIMSAFGEKITVLGSLIPPIILFVSTSDAIHLMNAYRKNKEKTNADRIQLAIQKVFIPTILTSVTTAIGFLSLLSISTEPVQTLGLFAGLGVVIALFVTFVFGPLLIYGWHPPKTKSINFKPLLVFILKNQKSILISTFIIILISIIGISRVETNARLLDDLPESSLVRQNFEYAEQNYFGYKPWEIAYWPIDSNESIWNQAVMIEAQKIHQYLEEEYIIGRMWSPIDLMQYGNQMISGGNVASYQFPQNKDFDKALKGLEMVIRSDSSIQNTVSSDHKYARIVGFIPELGSKETGIRNEKLLEYLSEHIDSSVIGYQITGTTYLIDKSHSLLSKNLITGLLIAIALVSLVLGLYFRSIKIMIISLIPNVIPLIITAAFMGFTGIPLKLTTSIIFAVSFGIAVDDTIHFISIYRLQKSTNTVQALLSSFQKAGSAILVTSIIILAGFGIFLFSSFGATYYLGLFLILSLTSALIIDLTLLPIILNNWNKKGKP